MPTFVITDDVQIKRPFQFGVKTAPQIDANYGFIIDKSTNNEANFITLDEVNKLINYDKLLNKPVIPPSGGGDVSGTGFSIDNALVRWNGATGKLVKNSGAILNDNNTLIIETGGNSTGTAFQYKNRDGLSLLQLTEAGTLNLKFDSSVDADRVLLTDELDNVYFQIQSNGYVRFNKGLFAASPSAGVAAIYSDGDMVASNGNYHNEANKFTYFPCAAGNYTVDTVTDIRIANIAGIFKIQRCTVANATKGAGTWVNLLEL